MTTSTTAKLTCPVCGHQQIAEMPTDACQFFFDCENCESTLKPRTGDCCVFCSYADRRCPPEQAKVDDPV